MLNSSLNHCSALRRARANGAGSLSLFRIGRYWNDSRRQSPTVLPCLKMRHWRWLWSAMQSRLIPGLKIVPQRPSVLSIWRQISVWPPAGCRFEVESIMSRWMQQIMCAGSWMFLQSWRCFACSPLAGLRRKKAVNRGKNCCGVLCIRKNFNLVGGTFQKLVENKTGRTEKGEQKTGEREKTVRPFFPAKEHEGRQKVER